ncbi:MAG: sigma-54 dependent transcriptional regulator [Planctomycetota bacterium]
MKADEERAAQGGPPNIVMIEDHEMLCDAMRHTCCNERWNFQFFATAEEALAKVAADPAALDLVAMDLQLPGMDGAETLRALHQIDQVLPVIILTARNDSSTVVRCMKLGAYDYITKPFGNDDLVHRFRRALERRRLVRYCTHFESEEHLRSLMGPSQAVQRLAETIRQVSPTDMAVLIEGESGTGKEILARHIHALSRRRQGPFVAMDCGAIPDALLEGELFGFKKGSFTGALADREGKFQMAHGGTLFLDEIGNLPLHMQAKILRALQEKEVVPVGATAPVSFSARLVATSNTGLEEKVASGQFRLDLFHRIAEFPVSTMPLRERLEDLLYLCSRFLREACKEFGKQIEGFSEDALEEIISYPWPGNVRELRSVIRRAALVSTGCIGSVFKRRTSRSSTRVSTARLDGSLVVQAEAVIGQEAIRQKHIPLKEIRRQLIRGINEAILDKVLENAGGNKSDAARTLELDYKTVHALCKSMRSGDVPQSSWIAAGDKATIQEDCVTEETTHEQSENPRPEEVRV